jgi:hypothetical protein
MARSMYSARLYLGLMTETRDMLFVQLTINPGDQGLFHYAKFLAHDIPMNFSLKRHGKLTLTSHYAGILPEENARLAGQLSIYKVTFT